MTRISEVKTIKMRNTCSDGVYLRWENAHGHFDSYLFEGNKIELLKVNNIVSFDRNIDDLAGVRRNFDVVSKEYDEGLKCHAFFDKEEVEAFRQLAASLNVEIWHKDKWWRVDVVVDNFFCEKETPKGRIALTLIKNRKYIK